MRAASRFGFPMKPVTRPPSPKRPANAWNHRICGVRRAWAIPSSAANVAVATSAAIASEIARRSNGSMRAR